MRRIIQLKIQSKQPLTTIEEVRKKGGNIEITSHSCGATNVHNPTINYGIMKDREGNAYRTVRIGTQTWMAENLKTSTYRNGLDIPYITDYTKWENDTSGAYCFYDNDKANDCPYGKLYNWYAIKNLNGICPTGWHVPTDSEWNILADHLDPSYKPDFEGAQSLIGGNKMKSAGTQYWLAPNDGATNSSGFSALPGGQRLDNGFFKDKIGYGDWWSASTSYFPKTAWYRALASNVGYLYRYGYVGKNYGFSVRCIKD